MAKLSLTDLTSLANETSVVNAINANNALIEAALEKTLSRDGTSPNTMTEDLDMNSQRVYNLVDAVDDSEPLTKGQFNELVTATLRDLPVIVTGTGDPTIDMAAINAALVEARAEGKSVFLDGTLALRPPVASDFLLYGRSDHPVRICIALQSGDKLFGSPNCEVIVHQPVGYTPSGNHRMILFGAASSNTAQGVYSNITIENININFRTTYWSAMDSYYLYAFGFIGVDHVVRRNCRIYSSGVRAGRGIIAFNCRHRVDTDIRHENITQGYYVKYDHYLIGKNIYFNGLVEALDIDGYCEGMRWSGLTFLDLVSEGQAIDTSSIVDCIFENIYAKNTKALFFTYSKETYGYSFADYWTLVGADGTTASVQVESRDIIVRNVLAEDCGAAGEETFRISNSRQSGWTAPCIKNVILENWVIDGGYGGVVYECDGIHIKNMVMRDVLGYVSGSLSSSYALRMVQGFGSGIGSAVANTSILSGSIDGLEIDGCTAGGVLISFPQNFSLKNIDIKNYNTGNYSVGTQSNPNFGMIVSNNGLKPNNLITFDGNIAVSGGPAGATDLYLSYLVGSSGKTRISKRNAVFSLASIADEATAIPVTTVFSTIVRFTDPIVVHIPQINTVAAATVYASVIPVLGNDEVFKVQTAYISSYDGITGDASNYTNMTLQRNVSGTLVDLTGSTVALDAATLSAGSVREMTSLIDTTQAEATILPGGMLGLKFVRVGTGSIRNNLVLELHGLRYRRVVATEAS